MKQEQKLIGGVAVLAVLGGLVYMSQSGKKKVDDAHSVKAAKDFPLVGLAKADAEKVTKFVIENKDKGEVVLEKKGDSWRMTKPVDSAADQDGIKKMVENLEKLKLTAVIAEKEDAHEKYELLKGKAVHVQAFAGADKKLDVFLGKKGGRGQMARLEGNATVFAMDGYNAFTWAKEVKQFRQMQILKFEDPKVESVTIENANGMFAFGKADDKWSGTFKKRNDKGKLADKASKWEKFEATKVADMLRAFKGLKATDFGKKGDDTGLDAPAANGGVVTIKMKEDAATYVLKIGKAQEGTNRYAEKTGGDGTIYVVSSWAADWAAADTAKFEKSADKDAGKNMKKLPGGINIPGMGNMGGPR